MVTVGDDVERLVAHLPQDRASLQFIPTRRAPFLNAEVTAQALAEQVACDFIVVACAGRLVGQLGPLDAALRERGAAWAPLTAETRHIRLGPFFAGDDRPGCYGCYVVRRRSAVASMCVFDMPQDPPVTREPAITSEHGNAAGALWTWVSEQPELPVGTYVQVTRDLDRLDRGSLLPASGCARCGP